MPYFTVKPSEVLYSQDSIGNKFKNGDRIGDVLDDILEGNMSVKSLPKIKVKFSDGKYISADNRRLWILKQLEMRGEVNKVTVKTTRHIPRTKPARTEFVKIRGGSPGGSSVARLI